WRQCWRDEFEVVFTGAHTPRVCNEACLLHLLGAIGPLVDAALAVADSVHAAGHFDGAADTLACVTSRSRQWIHDAVATTDDLLVRAARRWLFATGDRGPCRARFGLDAHRRSLELRRSRRRTRAHFREAASGREGGGQRRSEWQTLRANREWGAVRCLPFGRRGTSAKAGRRRVGGARYPQALRVGSAGASGARDEGRYGWAERTPARRFRAPGHCQPRDGSVWPSSSASVEEPRPLGEARAASGARREHHASSAVRHIRGCRAWIRGPVAGVRRQEPSLGGAALAARADPARGRGARAYNAS